jgi:hypothetical protein
VACAAFSSDGALATGTILNGDLETRLSEPGGAPLVTRQTLGRSSRCEEAFTKDGDWLATVVASSELKVVAIDRKALTVHRQFFLPWEQVRQYPPNLQDERWLAASFLAGFLQDDSLALWRYPTPIQDKSHVPERICTCNAGAWTAKCSPIRI